MKVNQRNNYLFENLCALKEIYEVLRITNTFSISTSKNYFSQFHQFKAPEGLGDEGKKIWAILRGWIKSEFGDFSHQF